MPAGSLAGCSSRPPLVLLAGCSPRPTPPSSSFSRARAEELEREGRAGCAGKLVTLLDDPPRYLNTALLLRLLCEIARS
jgi:hypothetical protein